MDARLHADDVAAAARAATGRADGAVAAWTATTTPRLSDNMTTLSLHDLHGEFEDGTTFRCIVKTLRPASASPLWNFIPEPARANVLAELDWLDEVRTYRSSLRHDLPRGLQMPSVWHIAERGDVIHLYLQQIDDVAGWDLDRYAASAHALGALSGRWPAERVVAELGFRERTLDELWFGKTSQHDLPRMASAEFWTHAALANADDLRRDLRTVVDLTPTVIDTLRRAPLALTHGDACPSNLLRGHSGDVVAIDWSYCSLGPIGSDLGQLIAGRFVEGCAQTHSIEVIADTIVAAFADGLRSEGSTVDPAAVELALVANLLLRAAFDALATVPEVSSQTAAARLGLARFAFDRALALST